jgi:predicted acyltransferase
LDALRGFDLLWIMGLSAMFRDAAKQFPDVRWLQWMGGQMAHASWEGFTLEDLIFPLFLFISGVTIPFSLLAKLETGAPKWRLHLHTLRRMLLLVVLGIVYNGGLAFSGVAATRFASVLGFIGIGYFFAAVIAMNSKTRWQVVWLLAILLGYWAALEWIPVPGVGAGKITPKESLSSWLDQQYLPGRLHVQDCYDPQGILPCISGIATALAGVLTGQWLRKADRKAAMKTLGLFLAGAACLGLGQLWGLACPIIKNLWTSSFVLKTAGLSLLLLGLFYLVIDVWGFKKWAFAFVVIGMNSITIYMACRLIDFRYTAKYLFDGLIHLSPQNLELYKLLMLDAATLALMWMFLFFLHRKKVFLRI